MISVITVILHVLKIQINIDPCIIMNIVFCPLDMYYSNFSSISCMPDPKLALEHLFVSLWQTNTQHLYTLEFKK
jgi:hypothetical protein